jgi:hypothetical protein
MKNYFLKEASNLVFARCVWEVLEIDSRHFEIYTVRYSMFPLVVCLRISSKMALFEKAQ